jgi:hypothetical protein
MMGHPNQRAGQETSAGILTAENGYWFSNVSGIEAAVPSHIRRCIRVAVRVHLGSQLDRLLRDPGADPLSNIFVLASKARVLWPYYLWLIAALLVNAIFPMSYFLNLPGPAKIVVSCVVVFIPIFFAGMVFATSFRESLHPDVDFGSNIAGVILGGLSENLSLMLGFNHLLLVAIGYYVLSALLGPRFGGGAATAAS